MEGTPKKFDMKEFRQKISNIKGIEEIHELHVWVISVGKTSMTVHLYIDDIIHYNHVLTETTTLCRYFFYKFRENGIYHSTIQIEDRK